MCDLYSYLPRNMSQRIYSRFTNRFQFCRGKSAVELCMAIKIKYWVWNHGIQMKKWKKQDATILFILNNLYTIPISNYYTVQCLVGSI